MTASLSRTMAFFALVLPALPATALTQGHSGPRPPVPAAAAPAAEPAIASYRSSLLNAKPLPVADQATDADGVQYLIEFDELILSIQPNHQFRASLRYRQTLAARGSQLTRDPIQKMTVYGTWAVVSGALAFTPDPKRGGNGLQILSGTFRGRQIDVPFDYRNGTVARRASVVLIRDDRII